MSRAVLPLFRTFLDWLGEGATAGRRTRSRPELEVTPLEDRCLLAQTLLWIGANAATPEWSRQANWVDDGGNNAVPASGDILYFDPSKTFGTQTGKNSPSTNDLANLSNITLTLASGYGETLTLNQSLSVKTLTMLKGTITSAAGIDLTLTGTGDTDQSVIAGGTMSGAGRTIVDSGVAAHAQLALSGTWALEQRTLTNKGKIIWMAGDINTNNATVNNEKTFDIQTNAKIKYTGAAGGPFGSFNTTGQNGVVQKTSGAGGSAEIFIPFNVSSTLGAGAASVSVNSGALTLWAGGTSSSKFLVVQDSRLDFVGQAGTVAQYTWNAGTNLTGNGFYRVGVNGKAVTPGGVTVAATNVRQDAGEITGAGFLEISKRLEWQGGSMTGGGAATPGATTLLETATAIIGGPDWSGLPLILDVRKLNVNCPLTLSGTNSSNIVFQVENGAIINNNEKGKFRISDDSDIRQTVGAAKSKFDNTGLLEKTGGNGETEIGVDYKESGAQGRFRRGSGIVKFSGSQVALLDGLFEPAGGRVEVVNLFEQSGGSILVDAGATLDAQDTFTKTGGSVSVSGWPALFSVADTVAVSGGTMSIAPGGIFAAAAAFQQSGDIITVTGSGAYLNVTGNYTHSGGTTTVGGTGGTVYVYGSLGISGGGFGINNGLVTAVGVITIQSAGSVSVTNSGTINGNVTNDGTLTLAASALLEISGAYIQTGTLNVTLAGSSPLMYSRLVVSGLATLGGTLKVSLASGYSPSPMSQFTILTYGSCSGTFTEHKLPPLSIGVWQDPLLGYESNRFTLRTLFA